MPTIDEHLEKALAEYNEKVNELEGSGSPEELLVAYINRGTVLSMMDLYVSAVTDFDEAIGIMRRIEDSGGTVDPGCFVKAYVSRGSLESDKSPKAMADDYNMAASRLKQLRDGSRYYDRRGIIEMCLDCGCDLVDADMATDALPFTEKVYSLVVGRDDDWLRNRYMENCELEGQVRMDCEDFGLAMENYTEAVRVGEELRSRGALEDIMELVSAYVSKGDLEDDREHRQAYYADRKAALDIMEDLAAHDRLDDDELLSNLHGEVAEALIKDGRVPEAEKHLMRQVEINLHGAKDYIDNNADRPPETR